MGWLERPEFPSAGMKKPEEELEQDETRGLDTDDEPFKGDDQDVSQHQHPLTRSPWRPRETACLQYQPRQLQGGEGLVQEGGRRRRAQDSVRLGVHPPTLGPVP